MTNTDLVRTHIWVTGRVQGVGFRAFVADHAIRIGVTGWVRNVGWNIVEAVAEGTREQVDHFTELVKRGPHASHVDESRVEEEPAGSEFAYFEIRSSR